ncbi:MAG: S8 family serine peptidase [Firmicutes bacterium]|nr:S8 family serine peptidase [Bacillota bacterium]
MKEKTQLRIAPLLLALVMVFGLGGNIVLAQSNAYEDIVQWEHYASHGYSSVDVDHLNVIGEEDMFFDPLAEQAIRNMLGKNEFSTLTMTLGAPVGPVGFEPEDLMNPNEIVEIAVQFVTPPYVALRLMEEHNMPHIRMFADMPHQQTALSAHDTFFQQLGSIPTPFGSGGVEIVSAHYRLFNGIYMNVPARMVEQIAALPEVFAVYPHLTYTAQRMPWDEEEVCDSFMREALELFDMPRIHDEDGMNLHGRGARVAVLDTGIDYNHPVFVPFQNEHGRVTGWCFIRNNDNVMEASFEEWRVSGQPMYNAAGRRWITMHGTHVAGIIAAMAPGITMSHYRVLGPYGSGAAANTTSALERVHTALYDVVNLSLGSTPGSHPWGPNVQAINLMVMDGIIAVIAAGNSQSLGDFSLLAPGVAPLAISVGAGHTGGYIFPWYDAVFDNSGTGLMELHAWNPTYHTSFEDNLAGILTGANPDGSFNYVYLGLSPAATGDLSGYVAIIRRGATPFTDMRTIAQARNADALIIINNNNEATRVGTMIMGGTTATAIPIFMMQEFARNNFTTVGQTGTVYFGKRGIAALPHNDSITAFSSLGPVTQTFHIKPDIIAPGDAIMSTVPAFYANRPAAPTIHCIVDATDFSRAYQLAGGTSMAAPVIAGIAALFIEQNRDVAPYEVKARMMNNARPLGAGNQSVFAIGAGFVQPYEALNQRTFATVRHGILRGTLANPIVQYENMASLSYGIFREGEDYRDMDVTIHNAGETPWVIQRVDYVFPNLNAPVTIVNTVINEDNSQTLTVRMSFEAGGFERGLHQGHVIFSNGTTQLTMPFAGNLLGSLEITPRAGTGIRRPIITNSIATGVNDIRTNAAVSNASWIVAGFNDTWMETRQVNFFSRRVNEDTGVSYGDPIIHGSANVPPNSDHLLTGTLTTGTTAALAGRFQPGVYRLYMHVNVDGSPFGDYWEVGRYIVTNTRPTLTLDQDVFHFEPGTPIVQVTGIINSWGHDMAIKHGITTVAYEDADGNNPVFGYSFVRYHFGVTPPTNTNFNTNPNFGSTPNPDGTFAFNVTTGPATIRNPIVLTGFARDGNTAQTTPLIANLVLTTVAGTLRSVDATVTLSPVWPVVDNLNWDSAANELVVTFEPSTQLQHLLAADFNFEYSIGASTIRNPINHTGFTINAAQNQVRFAFELIPAATEQTAIAPFNAPEIDITLFMTYRGGEYCIDLTVPDNYIIRITPATLNLMQNSTQQFAAEIFVLAQPGITQDVNWTIYGNTSPDTSISSTGLLTVAADEEYGHTITVRAVHVTYSNIYATAAVNVLFRPSTDATLSSLDVSGFTLSPEFASNVLNYTTQVPHDVTSVVVNYTTTHANAIVTVTGNTYLMVGSNTVTVTVVAEDGTTTIVYTINVVREGNDYTGTVLPPLTGDNFIMWDSFFGVRGTAPFFQPSSLRGPTGVETLTPATTHIEPIGANESNTESSTAFIGTNALRWDLDFRQLHQHPATHSSGIGVGAPGTRIPQLNIDGVYRNPTSIGMWIRTEGADLVDLTRMFIGVSTIPNPTAIQQGANLRFFTQNNQHFPGLRTIYAYGDWEFVEFFLSTGANHSIGSLQAAATFTPAQHAGPLYFAQNTIVTPSPNVATTFFGFNHGLLSPSTGSHLYNPNRPTEPVTMFIDGLTFFYNYDSDGSAVFASTGLFDNVTRPVITTAEGDGYITFTFEDSGFGLDMNSLSILLNGVEIDSSLVNVNGDTATVDIAELPAGEYALRVEIANTMRFRTVELLEFEVEIVEPIPVFSWNIFNNGPGGTQYPRPNPSLAQAGLIRMWTQLDGVNAPVYLAAEDTIIALDQNGSCAMDFVRVGRVWAAGQGWTDYFNLLDIDKNGNWQYINLSITVFGQTVDVLLVNANYRPAADYHTVTITVEAGAVGVYATVTTTVEVPDGGQIPADAIPETAARTGFYFAGWYPSSPAEHGTVTEDLAFTARFNPLFHYVTFEAGEGGQLIPAAGHGLTVRIRDGFTFWADRVPNPVADEGYEFLEWYPTNPAGFVVRDSITFTAVFAEAAPVVPQIVSVTPNPAAVAQGGTIELLVTTQGMPDGAWVELNVAWRPGLSVIGGPRFYIVDNQATIIVAAYANARLGRDGFAVSARAAGQWGIPFIIDSYNFVIEVK